MRRRGPGGWRGPGQCQEQIFPVRFWWLRMEGFVQGKRSDPARPGQRLTGILALFCRRSTEWGGEEMPEPLHGSARKAAQGWQLGTGWAGAEQDGHRG